MTARRNPRTFAAWTTVSVRSVFVLLVAILLVGAITFWLQRQRPADSSQALGQSAQPSDATPTAGVERPGAGAERPAPVAQARAPAVVCRDQQMEVTAGGSEAHTCLGTTHTVRNGSVLTYRADPQSRDGRWLNIEAAGKLIVGAQIGSGGQIEYQCERDQCSGIAMSAYDPQGARSIVLDNATLFRKSATNPGEQETARVSGQVKILPDDQSASTTCVGQVLLINVGNESVHFCPDAGTGFDVNEDAGRTYRFTNADGAAVAVDLDANEGVRHVEYDGYSCAAGGCNGVTISAPEPSGARTFAFRGTMLTQTGTGAAAALLNGNLILDPQ